MVFKNTKHSREICEVGENLCIAMAGGTNGILPQGSNSLRVLRQSSYWAEIDPAFVHMMQINKPRDGY